MRSLLLTTVLARIAVAQAPAVAVHTPEAEPGAVVRLSVAQSGADSVRRVAGSMAGEPLRFLAGDGRFHAIAGVPVEASDSVHAQIVVHRKSGAADTMRVTVRVPHVELPKESSLAVSDRFTRPLDAKTLARIDRENARARAVGKRAHDAPPRWTKPFAVPRDSRVTSEFGTGRMFNGTVASRHLGVDFAGAEGTPVLAANRGVVALVDTFFLAGRIVYVDHGGGVVTGYFHLSKPLVAKGDTVERGQRIGLVGKTGRVTGPHLHWSARYGALAVNPNGLLTIPVDEYSARNGKSSDRK
jgi:murein DD-endopeptidase MepM/ murein hydrolase activator NlpD